jgi:hypothetical protein
MGETHAEFIEKARKAYRKIGSVPCPAFDGEQVYFTSCGFNHLIRKGRVPRKINEQTHRINLIPQAVTMICSEKKVYVCRQTIIDESTGYFWTFKKINGGVKIQVVVRQLNDNRKHFFSVM